MPPIKTRASQHGDVITGALPAGEGTLLNSQRRSAATLQLLESKRSAIDDIEPGKSRRQPTSQLAGY